MTLKAFISGIGVTFGLPWVALVALPYAHFGSLEPVPFDLETDEVEGLFPMGEEGVAKAGRDIYRAEGCVNCHTQIIRPEYAGMDSFKQAFGKDAESPSPAFVRQTLPYDYVGQEYALIGQVRNGPDLTNVGYRRSDPNWHYQHLYDPRSVNKWSSMPGFRHLFEKRRLQGPVPEDAVIFEGEDAVEPGYVIVPTDDARTLVKYLMSLKLADKVPASLGLPAPKKNAAATGAAAPAAEAPAAE